MMSAGRPSAAIGPLRTIAAFALSACGEEAAPQPRAPRDGAPAGGPAAKSEWTADEMAADPEGYLSWADAQLAAQIDLRQEQIGSVGARREELARRKAGFSTNYDDLVNVENRLATALRRADEEDRLPVRMGGRTFERAKAVAILAQIRRHLEERSPLMRTYDDGLAKLDQIAAALRGDVERLTALRDRLAVDLEQVRVSHGVAALEKLRSTEAEIAHYSKILASLAEDAAGALPSAPAPVDLDKLLE